MDTSKEITEDMVKKVCDEYTNSLVYILIEGCRGTEKGEKALEEYTATHAQGTLAIEEFARSHNKSVSMKEK